MLPSCLWHPARELGQLAPGRLWLEVAGEEPRVLADDAVGLDAVVAPDEPDHLVDVPLRRVREEPEGPGEQALLALLRLHHVEVRRPLRRPADLGDPEWGAGHRAGVDLTPQLLDLAGDAAQLGRVGMEGIGVEGPRRGAAGVESLQEIP